MANDAHPGVDTPGKRCRPVGDKQVTTAKHHRQQNVEQGKPVPPANHLGDFFTVALTIRHHKLSFVSLSVPGRR